MARTTDRLPPPAPAGERRPVDAPPAPVSPAFPGCRSFRLTRDAYERYDGRVEYWDAATETAWAVAETSGAHERPTRRLAALCEVVASLRGGAIACRGSLDLVWNAGDRARRRVLQADEVVWVYPGRARIPDGGLRLGVDDRPDVVLEVDHTTDVRRGKLDLYAAWGFPEVWVEVPDVRSPSRPAGRAPGLTIHRLAGPGRYRAVGTSVAFPGWAAAEVHRALNEPVRSPATDRALERVAGTLGERDGTGPDDTRWLRRAREAARREVLPAILAGRGMSELEPVLADAGAAELPLDTLLAAVQQCRDAADLRARLARRVRPASAVHTGSGIVKA